MDVAKLKIHGGKKELIVDKEDEYLFSDQYYWRAIQRIRYGHECEVIQGYKRRGEMYGRSHKLFYIHRLIMEAPSGKIVDHINHDIYDNRRVNLRICNNSENIMNSRISTKSTTGYKGVSIDKGNTKRIYYAAIMKNYKKYFLGSFYTAEEAALAYDKKARELFGEFAYLNFPNGITTR